MNKVNCSSLLLLLAAGLCTFCVPSSRAADANWTPSGNFASPADWNSASNWSTSNGTPLPPNAAGVSVSINTDISSANKTINLSTSTSTNRTVGLLDIGDANNTHTFTIAAGTAGNQLIFNNNGNGAQLNQLSTSRGDTLAASVAVTLNDNLTISNASTNNLSLLGIISGNKNLSVNSAGAGAVVLNAVNTFTGNVNIKSGALNTGVSGSLGNSANAVTIGDSVVGANASLNTSSNGIFSNPVTVASGSGTRTISNSGASVGTFSGTITLNNNVTARTTVANALRLSGGLSGSGNITVDNTGTGATEFRSLMNNSGTITNISTGAGGATFVTANSIGSNVTQVIQNSSVSPTTIQNANSGPTAGATFVVNDGTLLINYATAITGSATGAASIQVNNGTLAGGQSGSGTSAVVSGPITIGDGVGGSGTASLSAGTPANIGTFKTGAVNLANNDAAFRFDLNSTSLAADQLVVTGGLSLGSGVAQFVGTDLNATSLLSGQFILATTTSGITGNFAGFNEGSTYLLGGNSYRVSYGVDVPNSLSLTVVPEPSAIFLLAGGLTLLMIRWRR